MLPWPPQPWGTGKEESQEEPGPLAGSDQGEAWSSGEEAPGEPGTPPQDSQQPQALGLSWSRREQQLARHPQARLPSSPQKPQVAWEVAPSRMTLLSPWDPNYEAKPRPWLVWGSSCGSGASFSGRTLCHPSFWPMYEVSGRAARPLAPTPGHQNEEQSPRDAGLPVMCCEDVFLLDPLLPCGQRVPLYLSEPPQQNMGSLKLLLPPPIMSPSVCPSASQGCSTAWLSGPELIALTGLLQMSQGDPRPSSPPASPVPASCTAPVPVSDHPGPSGSQSCSGNTDPPLPQTQDTHCP
ncbi:histone deacetylase complex subunit SAP25 isoform 1-T1 [Callospermophilus lateralis]|uniref:histone deacetylase complex subunit SAP25 isoform X1 n=1 Tax=Callospermophilus lateralis TaxID=76772 RepID=UPI0040546C25